MPCSLDNENDRLAERFSFLLIGEHFNQQLFSKLICTVWLYLCCTVCVCLMMYYTGVWRCFSLCSCVQKYQSIIPFAFIHVFLQTWSAKAFFVGYLHVRSLSSDHVNVRAALRLIRDSALAQGFQTKCHHCPKISPLSDLDSAQMSLSPPSLWHKEQYLHTKAANIHRHTHTH